MKSKRGALFNQFIDTLKALGLQSGVPGAELRGLWRTDDSAAAVHHGAAGWQRYCLAGAYPFQAQRKGAACLEDG